MRAGDGPSLADAQVTGITAAGDTGGKRTGYARYALQTAGRDDIPVAAGADTSLGVYRFEPGLPEESRYWPEAVPALPNDLDAAIELLKDSRHPPGWAGTQQPVAAAGNLSPTLR